jgi:hypothetical protein
MFKKFTKRFATPTEEEILQAGFKEMATTVLKHKQQTVYHQKMSEYATEALRLAKEAKEKGTEL